MGQRKTPGLINRRGVWHIDKEIAGYGRLCLSTRSSEIEEANRFLARQLEEIRKTTVYGERPRRTFRVAATRFLEERMAMRSVARDAQDLAAVDSFIGSLDISNVHNDSLKPFVDQRIEEEAAAGTINRAIRVVHNVLEHCADRWRDATSGKTWLESAPKLRQLSDNDKRPAYPLDWMEQALLFEQLPLHLRKMATFGTNTGCRQREITCLRWAWEYDVPELKTSVFIIPAAYVKNGKDKLVVLNRVAKRLVNAQRRNGSDFVFTIGGRDADGVLRQKPVKKMYNSAWKRARAAASREYQKRLRRTCPEGFLKVRVHDLRHTFGRRLRAANVSLEDRQDLLGHESGRVTTDYSAPEIANLIKAADKAAAPCGRASPAATLVKAALVERRGSDPVRTAAVAR